MITVIQDNSKIEKKKLVTCSKCESVIEYNKEDVKDQVYFHSSDTRYLNLHWSIKCPCCESNIKLDFIKKTQW